MSSLLWTVWLYMPCSLRLKAYKMLEKHSDDLLTDAAVKLPFSLYAKRGAKVTVSEALATHYVSIHTTIPVPTVLDVLPYGETGGAYYIMTCLPGREIAEMPRSLNEYTDQEMDVFVATVGGWFNQLRALGPSPHGDSICGFTGGPLHSYRIYHDETVGPYPSQDDFHAEHYNTLPEKADPDIHSLAARLRSQKRYKICLTHGDITPNNILVDDSYKPVALIDWGCAAWMPEYWELTCAIYRRQRYPGWVKAFTQVFPHYEDELAVEMEQWNYICPW